MVREVSSVQSPASFPYCKLEATEQLVGRGKVALPKMPKGFQAFGNFEHVTDISLALGFFGWA